MKQKRVPCPECAELIQPEAKKCPFCRSNLKKKNKLVQIIKKILVAFGALFLIFAIFILYLLFFSKPEKNNYTGQELFNAVNAHREKIGLKPLAVDPILCDGLGGRLQTIVEKGGVNTEFHKWLESKGLEKDGQPIRHKRIGELSTFKSPSEGINEWVNSPGHRGLLEHPDLEIGCSYANNGAGIIIVATKLNQD